MEATASAAQPGLLVSRGIFCHVGRAAGLEGLIEKTD